MNIVKSPAVRRKSSVKQTAYSAVRRAIATGRLPKLDGSILCVDCGAKAEQYDHSDYTKPLAVDPVCRKCNRKRKPIGIQAPRRSYYKNIVQKLASISIGHAIKMRIPQQLPETSFRMGISWAGRELGMPASVRKVGNYFYITSSAKRR